MLQPQSTPIEQAVELFQLHNRARRLTTATQAFYRDTLTPFVAFCKVQDVRLTGELTPGIIRAYLVHLQDRGLAAHTVHGAARSIRTLCSFLVGEGLLTDSPMRRVAMPRTDRRILPAFTVEDVHNLVEACQSERDTATVLFLVDTGLRAAEFCELTGADVDLEAGAVHVRLGKGRKGRVVYFGDRARKQMLRYYMHAGKPRASEPVFRSMRGGAALTTSGLRQILLRLGKRALVPHCNPHTFRRTFALWSLRSGMPLPQLQRLMGHADIGTTQRYLRLVDADVRAAHARYGPVDTFLP